MPRIVALTLLNGIGVPLLNDLPTCTFAVNAGDSQYLTPTYSYTLSSSFRPHNDYRTEIRRALRPMEVLVGQDDEVFRPDRFAAVFEEAGRPVRVTVVPGVGHIGLTVQPAGIDAIVSAVGRSTATTRAQDLLPQ